MNKFTLALLVVSVASLSALADNIEPSDSLTRELQEIIVEANQPATKLVGSTLVSTIAGSSLQNLGTAVDVLAQLPMITVNDGDVTVTGKGSPQIFIDGKPLHGNEELSQLRSINIRKVELLLAPGAMYDSVTKAVLKITTCRNFLSGVSGTDNAEISAKQRWSASNILDLNYRSGAWDVFVNAGIVRNNSLIKGSTINTLEYDGRQTVIGSSQHNDYPSFIGLVKAGFNYSAGDRSFGAYYRYHPESADYTNNGTEWIDDGPIIRRKINRDIKANSHLASLYYENTFAERYLMHFDGDIRFSWSGNDVMTSYSDGAGHGVSSKDRRNSAFYAGKLYMNFPVCDGSFTIGIQDSYTRTSLDYKMLNEDVAASYIPSSLTDARQISASAFTSWSKEWEKLSLSVGLRYEHVNYLYKVNGKKDSDVSSVDNLLTPDISIGYSFSDRSQVTLSYKTTTVKPPYSQLTGSLSYTGIHEIEGGNPALRAERMHDVQLFGMWNGFMLQADYVRSIDTYAYVKQIYPAPTLQLIMRPENIDVSAFSMYIIWNKRIGVWTSDVTLGMYKQWLAIDNRHYGQPIFSYSFNNMISLPKGFILTFNASGNTSGYMHTNRFGPTPFALNASISKSFLNKSLRVKLSATDIFKTINNDWSMDTYGILVEKQQRYDNRGVSLSVAYSFQPRKSKYKGQAASEKEMNRL